ncbi:MAG: UpxY family transcription antiterminator [Gemmatimonadetes bacterium]|nr:UpxY family transcription antiterminator [Gemmatimonadota bacterium]
MKAPPELYDVRHWYACRTRSRAEKTVARLLDGAGVECFLPLLPREREWSDRKKVVAFPLFPGYVFARFLLTEQHPVLATPGVVEVLAPNGYPTPVREEEIQSIHRLVEGIEETGAFPEPADYLEPGEPVVVTSGPFCGMEGVLLERRGGSARVAVRITALRQAMSVELKRSVLRRRPAALGGSAA